MQGHAALYICYFYLPDYAVVVSVMLDKLDIVASQLKSMDIKLLDIKITRYSQYAQSDELTLS